MLVYQEEQRDSSLCNAYLTAVVMSTKDKIVLTSRIPTVLHKTLFEMIGQVGGHLPETSMEETARELDIPDRMVEAFKLRTMRLLLLE